MSVTINVNGLSLAHKGSAGIATATVPDVCKTPGPSGPPVPMPYPNIAMSTDLALGTITVGVDGGNMAAIQGSILARSTGDEPGVAGGVTSQLNMADASWLSFSFDVQLEGKGACRLTDKLLMNHGNTMCCAGFLQQFLQGPKGPNECAELLKRIEQIAGEGVSGKVDGIRGLWERFAQQITGKGGPGDAFDRGPNPQLGLPNGSNPWLRHDKEIQTQQQSLQEHIDTYDKHCGGGGGPPVPQNARDWAKKQRPQPQDWKGPQPVTPMVETGDEGINWGKVGWGALGVLALAGAAVLVVCPFDGPVGEVAMATAAVAAFGMASGGAPAGTSGGEGGGA